MDMTTLRPLEVVLMFNSIYFTVTTIPIEDEELVFTNFIGDGYVLSLRGLLLRKRDIPTGLMQRLKPNS